MENINLEQYMRPVSKTLEEMQALMQALHSVFPVVRIVDPNMFRPVCINEGKDLHISPCHCYEIWKKNSRCHNCAAEKALKTKSQAMKLEYMGINIYQVVATYVEIEHNPYVLEVVYPFVETLFPHEKNDKRLLQRLIRYDHELYTDALTSAYNRRYFEDKIKENCPVGGIVTIDLDDFKLYNDIYGHDVGDIVLKKVVETIQSCIRRNDYLVRYGGDEFVLILPYIAEKDLERKMKIIQEKVRAIRFAEYEHLHVSVSIGGVIYDGKHVGQALRRADKLMYQNKLHKEGSVAGKLDVNSQKKKAAAPEMANIRPLIIIADNSAKNRAILKANLGDTYRILEAKNGEEVMQLLQEYSTDIALLLLDFVMPKIDGFEVLSYMRKNQWYKNIPVMMISSNDSLADLRRTYNLGVIDYIQCPFDSLIIRRRVANIIMLYAKQRRLIRIIKSQIYEKERNNRMMVDILSQVVEFRSVVSSMHVQHISALTRMLLDKLMEKTDAYHLTRNDRSMIVTASALHDLGKIAIDDAILNKPGPLTKDEFEKMKQHTLIGAKMIRSLKMYEGEELLNVAYEICRWHHERYDGRGYPDGLKGEDIPISAQVVALADVYDALTSKRVYKDAYSHTKALTMIYHGECGAFNPLLLECLNDIQDRIKEDMNVKSQIRNDEKEMNMVAEELLLS